MNRPLNIAIVGLGRVGGAFLAKLLERDAIGINIVAVADRDEKAPGMKLARQKHIRLCGGSRELVAMGEAIDIIFDLTGSRTARKTIRSELARSGNSHTVVVSEMLSSLIWDLMETGSEFPGFHVKSGY